MCKIYAVGFDICEIQYKNDNVSRLNSLYGLYEKIGEIGKFFLKSLYKFNLSSYLYKIYTEVKLEVNCKI